MLAITEIKVSELICGKFVPAKHGMNKGGLILLRESDLKEERGRRENCFFPPTARIKELQRGGGGGGGWSLLKHRKNNNIVQKGKSGEGGEIYLPFTSLYLACIPNVSI